MTMPKGFKSDNGYVTIADIGGKSYQEIANTMTDMGYKMNHSTARNICVDSMMKIVKSVLETQDINMSEKEIKKIAKDPRFQIGVSDIIREME